MRPRILSGFVRHFTLTLAAFHLRAKSSTLGAVTLCAAIAAAAALLAMQAAGANRDALRRIVQDQCLAHWSQRHDPAPCERLVFPGPAEQGQGYALLADRKGGAHFLLIPTRAISGIESAELIEPGAPNYFAAAWQARDLLAAAAGREPPRNAVGLAVNPAHARTQDQLHIHIECLRPDVIEALQIAAARITNTWSAVEIGGTGYNALRIEAEDLHGANPFELLAGRMPGAGQSMGDYTLVVAGMQFENGPGFIVLAATGRAGELLLDSSCAAAGN
jgi:CDP-diacylglycerol pyrophosphatase